MAKKEKSINMKLYAVLSVILMAVILVVICSLTFSSKYIAFHPDKLAMSYVDGIVETGDGYNAYKNTIVSKNAKYGDFIRENYIDAVIYRDTDYTKGADKGEYKGYNDDSFKGEKTLNDDGTLMGQLIEKMYSVYERLINTYGWDNYDDIYKNYLDELIVAREEIFADKYFSDEIFFTVFEANVSAYGKKLTGSEDVFDENTGVQLSYETAGKYEEVFGENYRIDTKIEAEEPLELGVYLTKMSDNTLADCGIEPEDISEVRVVTVQVVLNDSTVVATVDVTLAKIGMTWYVDNTNTDTSSLYDFYLK